MPKYGKIAVARRTTNEAGEDTLVIVKDDFEENRKALAVDWIKERGLQQGETLQIVRLDSSYRNKEVVERRVVVVEDVEEGEAGDEDAEVVEEMTEETDTPSYSEKLANDEYDQDFGEESHGDEAVAE